MNGPGGQFDPSGAGGDAGLDAYLDGIMPPEQRAAFEQRLARDPALAADLAAQKRIDGALASIFAVPPFVGLPTNGHPAPHPAAPGANGAAQATLQAVKTTFPYNLILAGLGVVAVTLISWLAYLQFHDPRKSIVEIYNDPVSARALPASCGGESENVESICTDVLSGRVKIKKLPAGMQIIGLGIEPVLSKYTYVIRAKIDGREVLVFIQDSFSADKAAAEKAIKSGGPLHVFQREANGTLLLELSPFEKARMLDLLEIPENPACQVAPGARS
jgi:hypothetical protein